MLTLAQLYKLGLDSNIDIFNGISLPENSPINRTTLIKSIIELCGLNIPVYADPFVMASAVALWSAKNQYTFEHVGNIYNAVYSPIENKDLYSDVNIDHNRDLTDNTIGNNKKNEKINSQSSTTSAHSGSDKTTEENTTSAYNSSNYQPSDKSETTLTHGETIKDNNNGNSTKDTLTDFKNDKKVNEKEGTKTITHEHGNVGVTSNNQLQTQEYEMLKQYNPYTFLAGLFENELTLFVY